MSFNQDQYNHNVKPTKYATAITQASDFTGNHFILGDQVTVTAFSQLPVTGNQNNTSVNQSRAQTNQKPTTKGIKVNTASKQEPAKPRQRAQQNQPNKKQAKVKQIKQQLSVKNELKINWKNKNDLKILKILNGSRMNGNQKAVDKINGFGDNRSVLPLQGTSNEVQRPTAGSLPVRELSRGTEAGQEEDHGLQGITASRQSPNFFDIRTNFVGGGRLPSKETNPPLNAGVIETINLDEETQLNNNINPIIQLKPFSAIYQTNLATPYVSEDNQSEDNAMAGSDQNIQPLKDNTINLKMSKNAMAGSDQNQLLKDNTINLKRSKNAMAGSDQNIQLLKDNTINLKRSKPSQVFESHVQPSTSVTTTSNRPIVSCSSFQARGQKDQREQYQQSESNGNAPTSTSQSNPNQDVLNGVLAQLSCHSCGFWIGSDELRVCSCGLVCPTCFDPTQVCAACSNTPREDAGTMQLHDRLAAVVPHPCRHRGCPQTVLPREDHESRCSFRPFHCYLCQQPVPMNRAVDHFQSAHPQQPLLRGKNDNVTFNSFFLIPTTEKRVAYCFAQDQHVTIMINKFESQPKASFLIHAPLNDDNTKITVKFEFALKFYSHQREVTFSSIGPAFVDIQMGVFDDWVKGLCTLDLSIGVKKNRKFSKVDVGSKKKKLKMSA